MEITKTTTKKFVITFFANGPHFTWKVFREIREKHHQSTSKFEKCFVCGYKFEDADDVNIISVSSTGNRFACAECAAKEAAEGQHGD